MRSLFLVLVAACATTTTATPKGGPRGLRASDHLDLAAQHDALAKQSWPDRTMLAQPGGADVPVAMPWYRSWDAGGDHERRAAEHRSQAAALEADYDAACAGREDANVSPLVRYGLGAWPTKTGVVVYLAPAAGTPDALEAALRCHRAWMMLAPAGMDDCPLDLPGLQVDARGDTDGITLVMSVADPKLVPELQRRAAHDLEVAPRAQR